MRISDEMVEKARESFRLNSMGGMRLAPDELPIRAALQAVLSDPADILALLREWGGEEVWWCEEHWCAVKPLDKDKATCPLWSWEMEHRPVPSPCRMTKRILSPPLDVLAADTGKEQ